MAIVEEMEVVAVVTKKSEIEKLKAIIAAQGEVLDWYEFEQERSSIEDSEVPEDLLELENELQRLKDDYESN